MEIGNEGFGPGDSKTNLLFWAATQSAPPADYEDVTYMINFNDTILPSCADNSACSAQGLQCINNLKVYSEYNSYSNIFFVGLTGECCPTGPAPSGIFLGCCPKVQYPLASFT